jgi:CubicO group peptidase (beta-lactamase class C family)
LLSLLPFYFAIQTGASPVSSSASAPAPSPSSTSSASNYTSILDDETERFINKILSDWKSPGGIGIAFVRKDDQGNWVNIETKGYGRANAKGDRVTEMTNFNVGSNSKV